MKAFSLLLGVCSSYAEEFCSYLCCCQRLPHQKTVEDSKSTGDSQNYKCRSDLDPCLAEPLSKPFPIIDIQPVQSHYSIY